MNDADWLRKHLRGKVQRSAANTPVRSKVRARLRELLAKALKRPAKPSDPRS